MDRISRHKRIRAKVKGTKDCPRLAVFRSNAFLYAQLIDDETSKTLAFSDTRKFKEGKTRTEKSLALGKEIAKKALDVKIKKVHFDRGGYKYHGSVKAIADGAREGGLLL